MKEYRLVVVIVMSLIFLVGAETRLMAASWGYKKECEYPDEYTVGKLIYRSNASNVKVHGQFGCDSITGTVAKSGFVKYSNITIPENYQIKLKVVYSKHSSSDAITNISVDGKLRGSFMPENLSSWNIFESTSEIDLGIIKKGVHEIVLSTEGQVYCTADLDYFILSGYPISETPAHLSFLPLLLNSANKNKWTISKNDEILEIGYGAGSSFPQYAALHLNSGYFRMTYGENSGWGTSVVVMPAFWENGVYYQGAPVTYTYSTVDSGALSIIFTGQISSLLINGQILISPPRNNIITAEITASSSGNIDLDNRPGEAFKPVFLSSMHISETDWDARNALIGSNIYNIPSDGWIIPSPIMETKFGLQGGTSAWKINAPSVEINLGQSMDITGWVTQSNNPNDDNVGFWAATSTVLTSWNYTLKVGP